MDFLFVLAQEKPPPSHKFLPTVADKLFEKFPPLVAIPVFIFGMIFAGWLLERVIIAVVRRASTGTPVNAALVRNLPSVLRPLFVLAGLHVLPNVLLREETPEGITRLTQPGTWVSTALLVLTVLVFAFCVARLLIALVDAWVAVDAARRPVGPTIKFTIKFVMIPIALLLSAEVGGAQIGSLLAAVSVGTLAVGLALQDTLKNVIAGLQIVVDQPIRAGDFVEIDKNVRGTVIEIGLRSTKFLSMDNNVVVIPNNTIAAAVVVNFDVRDKRFFQTLTIGVAYGVDTRRVQKILEDVAAAAHKEMPEISEEPARVTLSELGDSAIKYTVEITMRQFAGRARVAAELYHRMYDALRAEGIEIPYPTRTVHLRHDDAAPAPAAAAPTAPTPSP